MAPSSMGSGQLGPCGTLVLKRIHHGGTETRRNPSQDPSDDSVPHDRNVEVEEQPDFSPTESQIGQELGFMDWQELLNALEFEQDRVFHQYVNSVTAIECDALVDERKLDLAAKCETAQLQFIAQAFLVCGFEQSGAEEAMDFNRGANDSVSEFIVRHGSGNLAQGERW